MTALDPRTPVLVGIGVVQRREEDWTQALEPLDLMIEAVRAAGEDCDAPALLADVELVSVPRGRWTYANPGRAIADAVGAKSAQSLLSTVGVLQQALVANACSRIANGEISSAIVTGADAGYRILRAKISGARAGERQQDDAPDIMLEPAAELRHPAERAIGFAMPVGLYAIIDSALRAKSGITIDDHRDALAARLKRFSEIASANPRAWDRRVRDLADIRDESPRNPMQAFPYTRAHCSSWNVDQGAALLLCSLAKADELGIPQDRRIFPLASAEANHMVAVSERADLTEVTGARLAAEAVYNASGLGPADVDLVELYSCFPVAVEAFAQAAGLTGKTDLTITGGMPYAGGPYNNYFLQATARAVELLRARQGHTALLSCISGIMTKQAFAMWSCDPGTRPYANVNCTAEAAESQRTVEVLKSYSGTARVAGATVLHGRGEQPRAVALVDTPQGARAFACSHDPALVERFETQEWVGQAVMVKDGELVP